MLPDAMSVNTNATEEFTCALAKRCLSRSAFLTGNNRGGFLAILRPSQ